MPTPDRARAAADYAASAARPVQLVTLTDATTWGGRSSRPGLGAAGARAGGATEGRITAFAASIEASEEAASRPVGELVAHLLGNPEATALAGAEAGRLRRLDRPSQSPPTDRQHHVRWSRRPRLARRHAAGGRRRQRRARRTRRPDDHPAHARRRRSRASLGPRPHGVVPIPVASRPEHSAGDPSRMFRRFDVDTYLDETSRWNVEKFVNVAAATGRHSIEETIELDNNARASGRPDAIIGGLPPTGSVAEATELIDRQMTASRFRGVRQMGANMGPLPDPAVLDALQERHLLFELMTHPDQLRAAESSSPLSMI